MNNMNNGAFDGPAKSDSLEIWDEEKNNYSKTINIRTKVGKESVVLNCNACRNGCTENKTEIFVTDLPNAKGKHRSSIY